MEELKNLEEEQRSWGLRSWRRRVSTLVGGIFCKVMDGKRRC